MSRIITDIQPYEYGPGAHGTGEIISATPACQHPGKEKFVDKLGPMLEQPDGSVSAKVLAWHWYCPDCRAHYSSGHDLISRPLLSEDPTARAWLEEQEPAVYTSLRTELWTLFKQWMGITRRRPR